MKKYRIFLIVAIVGFLASACVYDSVVPEQAPPIDGGGGNGEETVSFAADIIPIFESKCTACHKAGGVKPNPDLTSGKAYTTIATAKYISVTNPEQSLIYTYTSPGTSTHTQKKYTTTEAQKILIWIQEGAKNN